ncbi:MAG: aminotransferase class V-fold PLP-dependent enzyme [Chloroflexi bacterium]|jgi:dTDP-4-amino-4,6-dideoxygalactose transaminase|nr:aminotransferase class V-fold PLP-dependent enzyme [Chloroflexota bacterium]
MVSKLAIDGGTPVRATRLRGGFHGSAEIDQREVDAVVNVLKKKRLFRFLSEGEAESETAQIEAWYRQRLGRQYALAVNGGTAALVAAMYGINAGPGDEVILPAYTYVATAAAVIAAGAVPVIAEIDDSLNMDPADLENKITPHTKAVIPVHMRGVPARMDEIMAVARRHNLLVVEDVAQSNGASYKGKLLGSFGDAACFSFQQYKIITSGEGGLVATNDVAIYNRARMQHDCAIQFWEGAGSQQYNFVVSGENYRISELAAALVLAQTDRLEPLLGRFRAIKRRIVEGVADVQGITLQDVPDPDGECAITFTFFAPDAALAKQFAAALNAENISCGTMYDNTIPDRHIYCNWPFMMSGLAEDRRAPWKSPFYQGNVRGYSRDQCARSLDYLGRAIMIFIDQSFTDEDADLVAEGIRKVAGALL